MKVLKSLKWWTVVAAIAFLGVVLLAPGSIALALVANVPTPGAPPPVNVLPSTVTAGAPVFSGATPPIAQYNAIAMYQYARTPEFWRAVAAAQAGTATPGQVTLVQQANGNFAVPATRGVQLIRAAGAGAGVVSAASLGLMIGNGISRLSYSLAGEDYDEAMCTSGIDGAVLSIVTGADCAGYAQFVAEYQANLDVTAGTFWPASCAPNGLVCVEYVGSTVGAYPQNTWVFGCFRITTGTWGTQYSVHVETTGGISGNTGLYYQSSGGSPWSYTNCGSLGLTLGSSGGLVMKYSLNAPTPVMTRYQVACSTDPGCSEDADPDAWVYEVSVPADPERTLKCVIAGSDSNLYQAVSAPYTEGGGVLPSVVCPDLPAGVFPASVEVFEVVGEDESLLLEEVATEEFNSLVELAPECLAGTCLLDLRKESVGSCFQAPTECAGWFADPDKGSKYSCHYGTHAVDLAECTVYAPTFTTEATITGNVYGDPATGEPMANPSAALQLEAGGEVSTSACWPTGWSVFNPAEWVYRPIVCAATWAFVPRPAVVTATATRITTAWADTLPGQAPAIVEAWADALPDDIGGCQGPVIDLGPALEEFNVTGAEPQYPLSACEPPFDGLAAVSNVASAFLVVLASAFATSRYMGWTIGFGGFGGSRGPA